MANRALIIVDMLNDFINEEGTLYCGPRSQAIIRPIAKRLQTSRQQGDSVIFMQDSHDENDPEFDRFPRHCIRGTWGSKVINLLAPLPNEPVIMPTLKPLRVHFHYLFEGIMQSGPIMLQPAWKTLSLNLLIIGSRMRRLTT
jgi:nicotinamidase-related amidase